MLVTNKKQPSAKGFVIIGSRLTGNFNNYISESIYRQKKSRAIKALDLYFNDKRYHKFRLSHPLNFQGSNWQEAKV